MAIQSEYKTLLHYLYNKESSDDICLGYKLKSTDWNKITWRQYLAEINKVALGLLNYGFYKHAKVAILSNSRFEWCIADYAIMSLGGVTIPIYQNTTNEDLEYILNLTQCHFLFVENNRLAKQFFQIKDKCPSVKNVICFENNTEAGSQVITFNELKLSGKKIDFNLRKNIDSIKLTDFATIIFTSGTTGRPKGVVLTHEQVISEVSEAFNTFQVDHKDKSLTFLPFAHVLGRIEHWGHVYAGFQLYFAESLEKIKVNLLDVNPTFMIAVPRIFEKIYSAIQSQVEASVVRKKLFYHALEVGKLVSRHKQRGEPVPLKLALELTLMDQLVLKKIRSAFGKNIRFCISGGAALSVEISEFFHACGILILEGYGLSETTAAICVNTSNSYRFGTVGKPIGDVKIKIADDGEILVKSKKVMKEYYQNTDATQEVLKDGWFYTGDIGQILPSGDLQITDRKKDLIKTAGGKYIAPQKIEALLKTSNLFSHTFIYGEGHKFVVAILILDKALLNQLIKTSAESFDDHVSFIKSTFYLNQVKATISSVNSQLASFETIKKYEILCDDLSVETGELTPSLKLKRKVLTAKYQQIIDKLYS